MSLVKKVFLLLVSILFIQCGNDNEFLIKKGNVGNINKKTTVQELNSIFKNDSIAISGIENLDDKELNLNSTNELIVYSKAGKKMLEIVPDNQSDSISKIKSVQIFDSNYKTDRGISLKSTFKEINENYMVNKVETTLTSATLFIDELNATISIDKKELGLNSFSREQVSIDQIPDIARIKYFTIWFN